MPLAIPRLRESRRVATAAFVVTSLLDAALAGRDPEVWQHRRWATKPALMPLLMASASHQPRTVDIAQAASWIGDIALLRDRDDRWFRLGVASFAVTHLAYTASLLPHARLSATGRRNAALVATAAAAGALSLRRDARRTRPDLADAVAVYSGIIGTMAATAAAVPIDRQGGASLRCGALLFLASDSLIGATTFTAPDAPRRLESLVMTTYTAGQLMLARAIRDLAAS